MNSPPGFLRVVALLVRTGLRRRLNRLGARLRRRPGKGQKRAQGATAGPARGGTLRRRSGRGLLVFLSLIFLYQGVLLSIGFVDRLAPAVEVTARSGPITVGSETYDRLKILLDGCRANPPPCRQEPEMATILEADGRLRTLPDEARRAAVERIEAAIHRAGLDGAVFRLPREDLALVLPLAHLGGSPEHLGQIALAVGLLLGLLAAALTLTALGSADAGRDWSMEWLFTFPVQTQALMFARVFEVALSDLFNLFTSLPLLVVLLWGAGFGAWSLAVGPLAALYIGVLVGAVVVPVETLLRKRLSPSRQRNFQGVLSALGSIGFLGAMAIVASPRGPLWLASLAAAAPAWLAWTPAAVPSQLLAGNAPMASVAVALFALAGSMGGARLAAWQVRGGLIADASPYQGARRRHPGGLPATVTPSAVGVVGKELRMLARNRTFLVQTTIVPAIVFGFQVVLNPGFFRSAASDMRHAAMLAFGLGAYSLLHSALNVLAVEGEALWILSTVPRDLVAILLDKVRLWMVLGLVWTAGTLIASAFFVPALDVRAAALHGATAIAGVITYSFIIAAIGVLATDPLETEPQRRLQRWAPPLVMLLGAMFGLAIYTHGAWPKIAQVVLSALLAAALWQKVRDLAPFMLDPTAAPPARIAVADGLMAALAFFVLQGVIGVFVVQVGGRPLDGRDLLIAFVGAGGTVTAIALYTGRRARVPELLRAVGLRGGRLLPAIALGLGGGAAAALAGVAWVSLLHRVPGLHDWQHEAERLSPRLAGGDAWVVVLAVVAAPLFEELIFRGLVFRGLRRSYPAGIAVFASAAIFAIVHPAISAPPVFVLALVCAAVFERSRLLVAPILAHAVYNAVILLAQHYQ